MDGFKNFVKKYGGALVGAIIALVFACTSFYRAVIAIVFVVVGAWIGNYAQKNKEVVKEKLKNFIDRL